MNNETNIQLYLFVDGEVKNQTVIPELRVSESHSITFLWTPSTTSSYNVTAYAPPLPEEEYTINNIRTKISHVFFYHRFYVPPRWIGGGDPMGWHADDYSWE